MKGLIIVNAYSENEDYLYQARRLQEEFSRKGISVEIRKNYCGIASIEKNGKITSQQAGDFAVFLDKDKYTMRLLEKKGLRLFNPARAIEICDDKMLTHVALANYGIPMPETLPAPFCYTSEAKIGEGYSKNVITALGLPVVVKHSYGSLGKEVFLAKTEEELCALATRLRFTPHFYQKYVGESRGKDLRVICVGGKAIAAMLRSAEEDFRSNIALGGVGAPFAVNEEIALLSKKISDLLELDYCGIDFLFGKEGLLLCEVNSNAFFKGIEKATGVNVAAAYAEHIINSMQKS
ncbi:MAG: RimK family alpha-L-glutamate ligase [Clostridia bacterium]|nr:RimK family alpha-L-glutamate ligase [Clostridia bacterium]